MDDFRIQQETARLKKLEMFIHKSCDIAFGSDVDNIEDLESRKSGDDFDAFEINFKDSLEDGIDGDDLKTFLECFNLSNSPGCIINYTLYARNNRLVMAIAVDQA